jgi:hypothetical protein
VGEMRSVYAHEARVRMGTGGDPQAVGAAVTVALCGQWDHEPPCPLAPHHTAAQRIGDEVAVRTLFAAEPSTEDQVRRLIEDALASGHLQLPHGAATDWLLLSSSAAAVRDDEREHGERLIRS